MSLLDNAVFIGVDPAKEEDRCIVRLTTNAYISGGTVTFSKVLRRLKRKSELTFDDIDFNMDNELDFGHIVNLMQVDDGIYHLDTHTCDYGSYWDGDMGGVEDWILRPYTE